MGWGRFYFLSKYDNMTIKELIKSCIEQSNWNASLTEIYAYISSNTWIENSPTRMAAIRGTLYGHLIWWHRHTDLFIRNTTWLYSINNDTIIEESLFTQIEDEVALEEEIINWWAYDFHLEKHLEDFLVRNLNLIEKWLKLADNWRQYRIDTKTTSWYIDLLAKDKEDNYVVIELKKWNNNDQVVGQILRYIWFIQEKFNTQNVKWIIVTHESDEKLKYAIKAVSNVSLKEYEISFKLK